MQVYVRAHQVPAVVPETCCLTEPLNSKMSFNSALFINFSIGICCCSLFFKAFSTQPYVAYWGKDPLR